MHVGCVISVEMNVLCIISVPREICLMLTKAECIFFARTEENGY